MTDKRRFRAEGCVAVFDSGMGGVTFLHEAARLLPQENFLFYGDMANMPYGEKSQSFICKRTAEILEFFLEKGAKAVVLACNTATSAAVSYLRERYPELLILGMEPAVQLAVNMGEKRIVLLSTPVTAAAANTQRLLSVNREAAEIVNLPCPGLMDLVENEAGLSAAANRELLLQYLKKRPGAYLQADGAIVLGCTHYIYLKPLLRELFPGTRLYDGNCGTAENLRRRLLRRGLLNPQGEQGRMEFCGSIEQERLAAKARDYLTKIAKMQQF